MRRLAFPLVLFPALLPLAGCNQGYSPNTYASSAAQVEATVQRGLIIGVRQITISPDGTIGAATGGAAGGVAGSQLSGAPVVTALGAIGGTLVGGIGGAAAAQAVGKMKGWEYIVQEEPGDKLVSVTQTSKISLPIGLHVLVIAGTQQARIVPDYTVQLAAAPPPAKPTVTTPPATPFDATSVEVHITPSLPPSGAEGPSPAVPIAVASDPTTTPVAADPPPTAQGPSATGDSVLQAAENKAGQAKATPIPASTTTTIHAPPGPNSQPQPGSQPAP